MYEKRKTLVEAVRYVDLVIPKKVEFRGGWTYNISCAIKDDVEK